MNDENTWKQFETAGLTWEERAKTTQLQAVIDPSDYLGRKNGFINYLHKSVLKQYLTSGDEIVLDFGCGTGRFTQLLSENAIFVVGVDITKEMVRHPSARKLICEKNVSFLVYDGIDLPFKEASFDCIISVYVLQYAKEDFFNIGLNLVKCLKEGGKIVLIEQVRNGRRTSEDYRKLFEGCKYTINVPIRRSNSMLISLVARGYVPEFMFPFVGKLEMYLAKKTSMKDVRYKDYLFVFEREVN